MLFQSQGFILIFLPLAVASYYAAAGSERARHAVLIVASLVFYGWWDARFIALLVGQIGATWLIAYWHKRSGRAGVAVCRHRPQPRLARDLQVSRFSPRLGGGARRLRAAARPHPAADRHQLLLVPAHLLSGRSPARRGAALSVPSVRAVRAAVSPSDRRPDRAAQRAGAAVRARSAPRRPVAAHRGRADAVHARPRQEGADRRQARRAGRSAVRRRGRRAACVDRRLERGARLLVPALPRLLGLHRDGDRHRVDVRPAAAGEFPPALSRDRPARVLAALAHLAVELHPRLSLHPARRQPAWRGPLRHGDARLDGPVRPLARRRLDLRGLGPLARHRPRRLPLLAAAQAADAGRARLARHHGVRARRLGAVSRRRFRHGRLDPRLAGRAARIGRHASASPG